MCLVPPGREHTDGDPAEGTQPVGQGAHGPGGSQGQVRHPLHGDVDADDRGGHRAGLANHPTDGDGHRPARQRGTGAGNRGRGGGRRRGRRRAAEGACRAEDDGLGAGAAAEEEHDDEEGVWHEPHPQQRADVAEGDQRELRGAVRHEDHHRALRPPHRAGHRRLQRPPDPPVAAKAPEGPEQAVQSRPEHGAASQAGPRPLQAGLARLEDRGDL